MTHFKLIVVMVLERSQVYHLFYQYPLLLALLIVNSFLQPLDYFNYFVKKKMTGEILVQEYKLPAIR